MSGTVEELAIIDGAGGSLFERGDRYVIPLYQRPYAWGEEHIERLIEDVDDLPEVGDRHYYLGSLVVSQMSDGNYEVIDGQQRLTTLYLLLAALGLSSPGIPALSFSCRERSDYTLRHLSGLLGSGDVEDRLVEPAIAAGLRTIRDKLAADFDGEGLERLKDKLSRTLLYRIEVPEHTDLNHYFEIMNTRGEQLEQHEILKAWLMEPLTGADAVGFARIWDACSDMSGYVQMRFGTSERAALFGQGYDELPSLGSLRAMDWGVGEGEEALDIRSIIDSEGDDGPMPEGGDGRDGDARFESVIDFRFFLLHALRVFVAANGIVDAVGNVPVDRLLDDKGLKAAFERVVGEGLWNGVPVDRIWFAREFAVSILRTRFLFDRCIIKREFSGDEPEGAWSLKSLSRGVKGSAQYGPTRFIRGKRPRTKTIEGTNRKVLMLQACLRVSYTSPRVMHWITDLLVRLTENPALAGSEAFLDEVERCAKTPVREFLEAGDFSLGVNTPHVVLNYLDYLLWVKEKGVADFNFEFRNSVEHWYPQNPSDGTFERWDDVDRFGNLCLVQRNVNSRFSNLSPVAKKSTFKDMIDRGSLKLRKMAEATVQGEDWRAGGGPCERHEEEMLDLLREGCGLTGE